MAEKETKEEVKVEQERWSVQLAIVDENTPPQKVIVDNKAETEEERSRDLYAAIVKILNNQEKLMQLLD